MKRVVQFYLPLFCFLFMHSCVDKKGLNVSGQVVDKTTKKGIPKAEVCVLGWHKNMMFDRSVFELHVITNEYGYYQAYFPKGHEINVAAVTKGYLPKTAFDFKKKKYYMLPVIELEKSDGKLIAKKDSALRDSTLRDYIFRDRGKAKGLK